MGLLWMEGKIFLEEIDLLVTYYYRDLNITRIFI